MAKEIIYGLNIKVICVSIDGDIINPNGTLTGGYQQVKSILFKKYKKFNELNNKLKVIS